MSNSNNTYVGYTTTTLAQQLTCHLSDISLIKSHYYQPTQKQNKKMSIKMLIAAPWQLDLMKLV